MNRKTIIVSVSIVLALILTAWIGMTPTSSANDGGGTAVADVRCRVFEVPTEVADQIVPPTAINDAEAPDAAVISTEELEALVSAACADTGMLNDHKRTVGWWPYVADTFVYTKSDAMFSGSGGGAGFLGVRQVGTAREFNVDYHIHHHWTRMRERIDTKLRYRGALPTGPMVFIISFDQADGGRRSLVVAVEVTGWRATGT